ncbi:uncharacterized protein LOC129609905 isoform X1 [Condylostylus longicornis]|uniref:uncharacterized protein LOC129609905 isoform X1 n=1 Tax=Condylostylus longicornis TaxID=2530218 RepID=UPI00244DA1BA|nr:uncharacterized protein LOC129609905 isoform X1 [Condylostylus longicornis]
MIAYHTISGCTDTIRKVSSKKVKRKEFHHHPPPPPLPHHYETPPSPKGDNFPSDAIEYHAFHGKVISKNGYSAGTGLRVIAQGSADQANTAVVNQAAAAKQAAYLAQNTLAQAAAAAATTALAALQGKEVILQKLEQQSIEAHQALEGEITQLQQAKRSAKTAQHAAQQSLNHVAVLTAALNNAQAAAEHAQKAAAEAAAELASQTSMVGQAKTKLEDVEQQLHNARLDYEATREAAQKASNSAQEAQNNANEAALHASIGLHESVVAVSGHENDFSQNHDVGDISNDHKYSLVGY